MTAALITEVPSVATLEEQSDETTPKVAKPRLIVSHYVVIKDGRPTSICPKFRHYPYNSYDVLEEQRDADLATEFKPELETYKHRSSALRAARVRALGYINRTRDVIELLGSSIAYDSPIAKRIGPPGDYQLLAVRVPNS